MRTAALTLENFDDGTEAPAAEAPPPSGWSPAPPRPAARTPGPAPVRDEGALPDFAREAAEGGPRNRRAADREPPGEPVEAQLARVRGEGRAEGFAAGVADAEARGRAELHVMLADLREQLEDARAAMIERETAVASAVRDVTEALLAGVAPAFARAGLAAEVAEAAAEAMRPHRVLEDAPRLAPRVRVAPAQHAAVREALAAARIAAPVSADPELGDLQARLEWAGGEDLIDLDALITAAGDALARHLSEDGRLTANG